MANRTSSRTGVARAQRSQPPALPHTQESRGSGNQLVELTTRIRSGPGRPLRPRSDTEKPTQAEGEGDPEERVGTLRLAGRSSVCTARYTRTARRPGRRCTGHVDAADAQRRLVLHRPVEHLVEQTRIGPRDFQRQQQRLRILCPGALDVSCGRYTELDPFRPEKRHERSRKPRPNHRSLQHTPRHTRGGNERREQPLSDPARGPIGGQVVPETPGTPRKPLRLQTGSFDREFLGRALTSSTRDAHPSQPAGKLLQIASRRTGLVDAST